MSTPSRTPWRYQKKANEFLMTHKYAPYSIAFNTRLEAEARNPHLDPLHRFMSAATRLAWGNLSDLVVDCMPQLKASDPPQKALNQKQLAAWMRMPTSTLNEAVSEAKERGFVDSKCPFIRMLDKGKKGPNYEALNPLESDDDSGVDPDIQDGDSPYLLHEKEYFSTNKARGEALVKKEAERERFQEGARRCTKEIRIMKLPCLAAWRDKQRRKAESDSDSTNSEPDVNSDSTAEAIRDSKPEKRGARIDTTARQDNVRSSPSTPLDIHQRPAAAASSSSSSSSVCEPTTTPFHPDRMPDREFAQSLTRIFVHAKKDNPTRSQIRNVIESLPIHPQAPAQFLHTLQTKIGRIKHPGALPDLVAGFIDRWPVLLEMIEANPPRPGEDPADREARLRRQYAESPKEDQATYREVYPEINFEKAEGASRGRQEGKGASSS
jgi:hypothetical protein